MTIPSPRIPFPPIPSWVLVGALCAAAAGCDTSEPWDAEFDCRGQEQSVAAFAGDAPDKAVRKDYPFNIDFHLRAHTAMVRSSLVKVSPGSDGMLRFDAKGNHVWVSGQFEPRSDRLSLVEERTLTIEGRRQQVRTTGQYVCHAIGKDKAPV